jgi:hypothetical protein
MSVGKLSVANEQDGLQVAPTMAPLHNYTDLQEQIASEFKVSLQRLL